MDFRSKKMGLFTALFLTAKSLLVPAAAQDAAQKVIPSQLDTNLAKLSDARVMACMADFDEKLGELQKHIAQSLKPEEQVVRGNEWLQEMGDDHLESGSSDGVGCKRWIEITSPGLYVNKGCVVKSYTAIDGAILDLELRNDLSMRGWFKSVYEPGGINNILFVYFEGHEIFFPPDGPVSWGKPRRVPAGVTVERPSD